ncbi:MAG: GlmU family protein [Ardenticatenia bacterium]|nr:GlmU family protein [Ardenticatenia bacterium]
MTPRGLLALFEDISTSRFLPLVWTRPVYDLRCGISTIREKIEAVYGHSADLLYTRPHLTAVTAQRTGLPVNRRPAADEGTVLLLSGRIIADRELPGRVPPEGPEALYLDDEGLVVAARLAAWRLRALPPASLSEALHANAADLHGIPHYRFVGQVVRWPWDLVRLNATQIVADAALFPLGSVEGHVHPGAHLIGVEHIYIAPGARVDPGAVLDASEGPIVVMADAHIMAASVIVGPVAVGTNSLIKAGACVYEGTSIGPVCKVGGEVEESIFQAYSNKQHDGFLGHAVIGEWCNLGAGTTNSDLKNNYSTVRVWVDGELRQTGEQFVGCFIGDHTKTGIGALLNTGTVIGVACNLYGTSMPPKFVPSFSWGEGKKLVEYRLEQAIQAARRMMARRHVELTPAEADLLTYIFAVTARERQSHGVVELEV